VILPLTENSQDRIREDPLRMLRAIRLACELDFKIEKGALEEIYDHGELLQKVSIERIRDEFVKILLSNYPKEGFQILLQLGLLKYFLPELESAVGFYFEDKSGMKNLFNYILDMLENLPSDLTLCLSILLYDMEKSPVNYSKKETVNKTLRRLKFKNSLIKKINILILEDWQKADFSSRKNIRQLISRLGEENILNILEFKKADFRTRNNINKFNQVKKIEKEIKEVLQERPPLSLKDLAINGKDLIDLGYQEGKVIGEILKKLLNTVIDKPELNRKEFFYSKLRKSKKLRNKSEK